MSSTAHRREATAAAAPRTPSFPIRAWRKFQLWGMTRLFVLGGVCLTMSPFRARMSHNNGIAGRGKVKIVEDPRFPECDFFEAGREFPCRIRHASAAYMDDAMRLIRSCSIKFADADFDSPCDFLLNTGPQNLFWNARQFFRFALHRKEHDGIEYLWYYQRYPQDGMRATMGGLRRNPTSYAQLYYHDPNVFEFKARDGKRRYCKFRAIPWDRGPESGLPAFDSENPTPEEVADQRILEGETRNRNYLKNEYRERVAREGVHFHLQMQLHEWQDGDSEEAVFCGLSRWDETTHPWLDLAEVHIDEILPWRDTVWTSFSITNHPQCIGIMDAGSLDDLNSINYMRARREAARHTRWLFVKLFGLPPEYPDDGPRNVRMPGS